ncbi:MAG: peptidase, partial [Planctomycetota bacterium]
DYFSNDSLIDLEVPAGTYYIGVSAKGNTEYDPNIKNSGFGGLSEGEYELRLDFRPTAATGITDTTGVPLDGDNDGTPGGVYDFWFVPNDPNNTLYVDKAAVITGGNLGTVGNPYTEIDQAIAAASPGDTIRVIGNGGIDGRLETAQDNFSYQIGFANNGVPLADGASLDLPQGVRLVIDSGAVLKMSRARIGVGSVSPLIDVSDSALQVLGTPTIVGSNGLPVRDATGAIVEGSVYFTSLNDDTLGAGNDIGFTPAPQAGDWGGIDFRGDLDTADEQRRNREDEGVFLNHLQYADLRYGGGSVSIGGREVVVSPIDMAITRPTIINSHISNSADAAIAATPDTFAETRFTDPFYQASGSFTPEYDRVGPDISGNTIVDNSINGLFIRVTTRTGDVLQPITTTTRLDDTDITHVLTENLSIQGTAGGPILISSAPSSLLVRSTTTPSGNVEAGTYTYRLTNVSSTGLESAASQPTLPVTLTAPGGVQLSQLPAVSAGSDFVSRRLYRAEIDPLTNLPGEFRLVAQLNASSTSFVDRASEGTTPLESEGESLQSRLDASLRLDPGTVLKIDGARIESRFGANLIAEGTPDLPIVFTSLEDQRYGSGGTFDTNSRSSADGISAGDWGGIYVGHGSAASIDNAVIAGAGGITRIEGGFASFNPIEVHQASLRLANSRFEFNADGNSGEPGTRVGRGEN